MIFVTPSTPLKLNKTLGWKAEETFETGIVKTIEWYLAHPERLSQE